MGREGIMRINVTAQKVQEEVNARRTEHIEDAKFISGEDPKVLVRILREKARQIVAFRGNLFAPLMPQIGQQFMRGESLETIAISYSLTSGQLIGMLDEHFTSEESSLEERKAFRKRLHAEMVGTEMEAPDSDEDFRVEME